MITLKYYTRWIPSGQVHRVNVLDSANTVLTPAPLPAKRLRLCLPKSLIGLVGRVGVEPTAR